jgi:hypothetical protein
MKQSIVAVSICALSCSGSHQAHGEPLTSEAAHFAAHERATLAGLPGVFLVVDGITPDLEALGLQQAELVRDIQEQLTSGGVRLLSRNEARTTSGSPYLYVNINAVQGSVDLAYSIRIELNQAVRLERTPDAKTMAATWQPAAVLATVRPADFVSSVRQDVRTDVLQFVRDFRAANSRS